MSSSHKSVNLIIIISLFLVRYQNHRLIKTPQHTIFGVGIVLIVLNQHIFGEESLRGLTYLTNVCFFLPKLYIEAILIPQKNNIIKGVPLFFG